MTRPAQNGSNSGEKLTKNENTIFALILPHPARAVNSREDVNHWLKIYQKHLRKRFFVRIIEETPWGAVRPAKNVKHTERSFYYGFG